MRSTFNTEFVKEWFKLNKNGRCKIADRDKPKSIFNENELFLKKYMIIEYSHLKDTPTIKKKTFAKFVDDTKFLYKITNYPNQKAKLRKVLLALKSFQDKNYVNFPFIIK